MKWLLTKTLGGDSINNYLRWIQPPGIEPVLVGSLDEVPSDLTPFRALLLTGGADINPKRYGEKKHPETKDINDERDRLELALIHRFLKMRKPILGVCRGIQVLSVALGGRLIQHVADFLRAQDPPCCEVHQRGKGRGDAAHPILLRGRSRLRSVMESGMAVNSAHHQAVAPDAIGRGLRVVAVSPEGIIEAVEGQGLSSPVLAVQWHPERLAPDDPASGGLLKLMISLCVR